MRPGGPRRWRRPGRGHGGLFWRIYLHGLLLLALVAAATAGVAWVTARGTWHEPEQVAEYAAEKVAELSDDPAKLTAELQRVHQLFGVLATVYGPDGATVIATSAEPPLAPVLPAGASPRDGPTRLRGHGLGLAVSLPGGRGHAVFTSARRSEPRHGLWFIATVLVALALGSVPLARSIAAPVERLTAAARALGRGDLKARSGVCARGEVGELARAFDEMAERIEALVRSEQELLANVSHEIRTPLARMRVALELAAEGDLEKARRFLGEIGTDLGELDRLVEDVLAAARLDLAAGGAPGALPIRREPLAPAALAETAAARFRAARPDRVLEVTVEPGLPALQADAALLARLLGNLLDNAAKYSDPPSPVGLGVRRAPGVVILEVRDRGIGVPPEDLPRLFTPFFRTDRSRDRGTGGVGLGLALARRIAEAHGGTLAAAAGEGGGTVLTVTLPATG